MWALQAHLRAAPNQIYAKLKSADERVLSPEAVSYHPVSLPLVGTTLGALP